MQQSQSKPDGSTRIREDEGDDETSLPLRKKLSRQLSRHVSATISTILGKTPPVPQRGSRAGINKEMLAAGQSYVRYTDAIPYYLKPIIPGFFNLANAAFRWSSLIFVDASVMSMLNGGLDLILSVVAARYIRKRMVTANRWAAVAIVSVGIALV